MDAGRMPDQAQTRRKATRTVCPRSRSRPNPPAEDRSGSSAAKPRAAITGHAGPTVSYSRVRYVIMRSPTSTYAAWQRLSGRPGGSRLFSVAAMARVPYFASVLPHVVRMEPGLAEVRVPKWFFVKGVRV